MSRANITNIDKISNNHVKVTFETHDGHRVYEYKNSSARAFNQGADPSDLSGRLIEHKKLKKK